MIMGLERTLDSIHSAVRQNSRLQLFTAFNRVLLALAFIPPSITKILHNRFTFLPDSNPVGHYFNALYETGFYYEFIGWGQLVAAILLLFPCTAHLGALLFLPIILNITVLTTSVGFVGTPYVTNAMFLAALYLVCWDYDRWKYILFGENTGKHTGSKLEFLIIPLFCALGGVVAAALFYAMGLANLHQKPVLLFSGLAATGLTFGFFVALHHRFMRIGPLENSADGGDT
jgi:hypothetical protein